MMNDCCSQPTPCIHNQDVQWRDKIIDESVARLQQDAIVGLSNGVPCTADSERQKLSQFFRSASTVRACADGCCVTGK